LSEAVFLIALNVETFYLRKLHLSKEGDEALIQALLLPRDFLPAFLSQPLDVLRH